MKDVFLTGIKPTGTPHIGNFFGAIKPSIELETANADASFYYFIADYHALTSFISKEELKQHTYEVAATWLACGLDPKKFVFYKQSDIPEIFELAVILANFTPKGLMNRAHAYKAIAEENLSGNLEIDSNVNMGLYNYPILMAADILAFNSTKVPVGKDQKQHIEIARDIAKYFNNRYGNIFVVPEPYISEKVATIFGTDGRKMSKSYKNTIQLFQSEKELEKTIKKIVTDSKAVNQPKGIDNAIFELFKLFANQTELKAFEKALNEGIGWGEAKKSLFLLMNKNLAGLRKKYNYYIQNKALLDEILVEGAKKARKVAGETLEKVKHSMGII